MSEVSKSNANVLMDDAAVERAIIRISHEIIEHNKGLDGIALIGIQRRGVSIAKKIRDYLESIENVKVPMGILDITFYRDDLSMLAAHPVVNGTHIPFDINNKKIVLVDDVLYTGRTVRSAIDAIFDMGRPASIELAILIDRGHRELPFRADFIGKNVPTSKHELISVQFDEVDGHNQVLLCEEEN